MEREFTCAECGNLVVTQSFNPRETKRFCDACLKLHADRLPHSANRPGTCADCGARSSGRGRLCSPCGRRKAGQSKRASAEIGRESMRRTALVLLRDWGRRHGGIGPTMASWNECGYYKLPALRVLDAFGGWLRALDEAGLEHPGRDPVGRTARTMNGRNRQMITGGWLGAKAPRGDAPVLNPYPTDFL